MIKLRFRPRYIQIYNLNCTIKIYDKGGDFEFDIVNNPCLDGDVPSSPSYGTCLSQLTRFSRVCTKVEDVEIGIIIF